MRKTLPLAALLASLLAGACTDSGPTAGSDLTSKSVLASSRSALVDGMIGDFFPRGLETATGTRFDHIDAKLGEWDGTQWTGDVAVARIQLAELIKFVRNKAGEIDAAALQSGEDRNAAAARLVLAMFTHVYQGLGATPPAPAPGVTDVTFDFVPAGSAALIQTPSVQAGLRLDEGSTTEDRVIVIARHPADESPRCSGPLTTDRCQYKPFYKFESYPLVKLQKSGRFAICHVFGSDGPTEIEDEYIQLAHNLPADPANYTENAIQEGQIEILPRATTQTGVVTCNEPPTEEVAGILGTSKRFLYAAAQFAGKLIAPRPAYAYDQGPEHLGDFFSDFVGVGAPNYVGFWNGSMAPVGSPSSGQPVTAWITSQSDAGVTGELRIASSLANLEAYNIHPTIIDPVTETGVGRFISSSSVSFSGLNFIVDPVYSPFSAAKRAELTLTRTFNTDGIAVLSGTNTRVLALEGGGESSDVWSISMTKSGTALVCLPGSCPPFVSLQAAPTGATANSTADSTVVKY